MADAVVTYARLARASFRAQLEYRVSFALLLAGSFLGTLIDFVAVLVIFHHVSALAGWSVHEVAFFYGTSGMALAIADLGVGQIERIHEQIKDGRFDSVLIRPVGTLLQVVTQEVALRRFGRIAQGAVVLTYGVSHLTVHWDPLRVLMVASMVVCGAVIFGSIFVIGSAVTFWTLNTAEMTNAFTYGGNYLTSWPLNLFARWLRVLALAVPLGFVNYFPTLYVLDKPDPLGLPAVFRFLGPPVAVVSVVAAGLFWRFAVRHYRSAGS